MMVKSLDIKKIFTLMPLFLAVFIVVSLSADISFLRRKTTSLKGEAGWQGMPDFKVFWTAGEVMAGRVLGSDKTSYEKNFLYDRNEVFYHFRYSPLMAILMIPFAKISFPRVAMMLWLLAGNAAFLKALMALSSHLKRRFSLKEGQAVTMLWVMFLGTLRYYLVVICQGQTDGIVALFLVLFLISCAEKNDILPGVLFSLIVQMKPFFAPLGFYFLAEKRYRAILYAFISMAILTILPAVFLGFQETYQLTKDWINMIVASGSSQVMNYKNQSLSYGLAMAVLKSVSVESFSAPHKVVGTFSVFFMFASMTGFFLNRKRLKFISPDIYDYLAVSVIVAISVMFSPISWEAYYMFLVIPLSLVFMMGIMKRQRNLMALYLAGYFILTLSTGTDITKFIPAFSDFRFINISLGSVLLFVGLFDLYRKTPGFSE